MFDTTGATSVELGTWTYGQSTDLVPAVNLPHKPSLAMIQRLESAMRAMPQVETETNHYFTPGMYGRECKIAADTVVVGKLHRHEHLIVLAQGEATVWTDEGMQRMSAPRMWVSKAGAKRALVTHSDCVFITTHASNETDLEALEAELIVPESIGHEQDVLAELVQGVYA